MRQRFSHAFWGEEASLGRSGAKVEPWGKGGAVGVTGLDNLQCCCRGVEAGRDGVRHAAMRIPSGAGRGCKSGG